MPFGINSKSLKIAQQEIRWNIHWKKDTNVQFEMEGNHSKPGQVCSWKRFTYLKRGSQTFLYILLFRKWQTSLRTKEVGWIPLPHHEKTIWISTQWWYTYQGPICFSDIQNFSQISSPLFAIKEHTHFCLCFLDRKSCKQLFEVAMLCRVSTKPESLTTTLLFPYCSFPASLTHWH